MAENLTLPTILEPYRERFEKHLKPVVKLKLQASLTTSVVDSKLAGYPYLPAGFEFPRDSQGNYMCLLAQINFSQMPHLEGFPSQGILQFYIANTQNYSYGIDFNKMGSYNKPNPQKDWRVLYFPEVNLNDCQTDFSFLGADEDYWNYTPLQTPHSIAKEVNPAWNRNDKTYGLCLKLDFEKTEEPPLYTDYQCNLLLNTNEPDGFDFWDRFGDLKASWEVIRQYNELNYQYGHKIGGYAGFSQEDPRTWDKNANRRKLDQKNPWLLLLQLESDDYLQWGDCGVGHLFIRKKDLQNLDFSKVWYHWDCC